MGFKLYTVSLDKSEFTIKSLETLEFLKDQRFENLEGSLSDNNQTLVLSLSTPDDLLTIQGFMEDLSGEIAAPDDLDTQLTQLLTQLRLQDDQNRKEKMKGPLNPRAKQTVPSVPPPAYSESELKVPFLVPPPAYSEAELKVPFLIPPPAYSTVDPKVPFRIPPDFIVTKPEFPTVAIAPPMATVFSPFTYFILQHEASKIVIKSAIPGVFNVKRGLKTWFLNGANIIFNPQGDEFTADLTDDKAIASVKKFIMDRAAFFDKPALQAANSLGHAPIATIQVDINPEPPRPIPALLIPPATSMTQHDEMEDLLTGESLIGTVTGVVTGAVTSTFTSLYKSVFARKAVAETKLDSLGVETKYPKFFGLTNKQKLNIIKNHEGWSSEKFYGETYARGVDTLDEYIKKQIWECPLSYELMDDPRTLPSGDTIDASSIYMCKGLDPRSRQTLPEQLSRNGAIASQIDSFLTNLFNELEGAVGVRNASTTKVILKA